MSEPNQAASELAAALLVSQYPSLAWMVEWSERVDDLWESTTNDEAMRRIIRLVDDTIEPWRCFCGPSCEIHNCRSCADLCRSVLPSLPTVEEMVRIVTPSDAPR